MPAACTARLLGMACATRGDTQRFKSTDSWCMGRRKSARRSNNIALSKSVINISLQESIGLVRKPSSAQARRPARAGRKVSSKIGCIWLCHRQYIKVTHLTRVRSRLPPAPPPAHPESQICPCFMRCEGDCVRGSVCGLWLLTGLAGTLRLAPPNPIHPCATSSTLHPII